MFAAFIALAASVSANPALDGEIAMPSDFRWALISGLERHVGGKFILSGISHAEPACNTTANCVTIDQIRRQSLIDPAYRGVQSIGDLAKVALVEGKAPAAIVSVRWIKSRWGRMIVRLTIQDTQTGAITQKEARLGNLVSDSGKNGANVRARLIDLIDAPS